MKILTVLAGASVGGAETFFVSLTLALARAGEDVCSVLKPNPSREQALRLARIPFDLAPFASPVDFTTTRVLRHAAKAFEPDVVLAFAGRAASFIPKGFCTAVGRLGGYYNLRNFKGCDHLVCNAPDIKRYVVEGGWAEQNVSLIPNFPFVPDEPAVDRASLNTPAGVPLAVALGRLHRNKGLDVLIRALARVPELFVWIAGEGPEGPALENLAHECGVLQRVRFLGWREDRAALYKAADFCVYPSREEPFGNVVVEAWACGIPIVTTASAGPAWLARDGEDALITPIDDVDALVHAIRRLMISKELGTRLVAQGKQRVATEFTENAIVKRYIDLFEKLKR
jgi:glycosyltransferase involved in cell wall biosynthesis